MRFTFINIRDILQKQNEILKVDSNNKWIFIRALSTILCK